jgi:hypothetical protein
MLLKLLDNTETDIISALEQKCAKGEAAVSFAQDPRVRNALIGLANYSYEYVHGGCNFDFVEYLDDVWVASYLLKEIGDSGQADELRGELLRYFNPFTSYHPVTKIFAYCEAIEDAETVVALEGVVEGMNSCLSDSELDIIKRAYPTLQRISDRKRAYLEKKEEYENAVSEELFDLVWEADDLVKNWDFSEASEKYRRAEELAKYQLRDDILANWIHDRMQEVANSYMSQEEDAEDDAQEDVPEDTQEETQEETQEDIQYEFVLDDEEDEDEDEEKDDDPPDEDTT